MKNKKYTERQKIVSEFLEKYPFIKKKNFISFYLQGKHIKVTDVNDLSDEEFLKIWERNLRTAEGIRKCQTEELWDGGIKFLREHFNVTVDINTLSDEEFEDLHDIVFNFELDESSKADDLGGYVTWENGKKASITEIGTVAMKVASYMRNQFIIGGRRYKVEQELICADEAQGD